jgi:hypothetical protein
MCAFIRNSAIESTGQMAAVQAYGGIRGISQCGYRLTFINYLNFHKVFPHEEPFVILN